MPDKTQFKIVVKNAGHTPAHDVRGYLNMHWMLPGKDLPDDFDYADQDRETATTSASPMAPASEETFTFDVHPLAFMQAKQGDISLFLYGHFDYIDAFDEPRKSTFATRSGRWTERARSSFGASTTATASSAAAYLR